MNFEKQSTIWVECSKIQWIVDAKLVYACGWRKRGNFEPLTLKHHHKHGYMWILDLYHKDFASCYPLSSLHVKSWIWKCDYKELGEFWLQELVNLLQRRYTRHMIGKMERKTKEGGELLNFLLGTMLPTKIKLKNILKLSGNWTLKDSTLKKTFLQTLCLI